MIPCSSARLLGVTICFRPTVSSTSDDKRSYHVRLNRRDGERCGWTGRNISTTRMYADANSSKQRSGGFYFAGTRVIALGPSKSLCHSLGASRRATLLCVRLTPHQPSRASTTSPRYIASQGPGFAGRPHELSRARTILEFDLVARTPAPRSTGVRPST